MHGNATLLFPTAHSRQYTLKDTVVPLGCGRSSKTTRSGSDHRSSWRSMKQWSNEEQIWILDCLQHLGTLGNWSRWVFQKMKTEAQGTGRSNRGWHILTWLHPVTKVHVGQKKLTDCATLQLCWSPYLKAVTSWTYWYCIIFVYSYIFLCFLEYTSLQQRGLW